MSTVRFFLTTGPGTFDAEWRAWLDRHPGVLWTGRVIVGTIFVVGLLAVGIIALAVMPPLWIAVACLIVAFWGWSNERDRTKRERQKFENAVIAALDRRRL